MAKGSSMQAMSFVSSRELDAVSTKRHGHGSPVLSMAYAQGTLFVTIYGAQALYQVCNGRLVVFAGHARNHGHQNEVGSSARFYEPTGLLAIDGGQSLLVADAGNDRIRIVNLSTKLVTDFAFSGDPGDSDGSIGTARCSAPRYMCFCNDAIVVSSATQMRLIVEGQVSTVASVTLGANLWNDVDAVVTPAVAADGSTIYFDCSRYVSIGDGVDGEYEMQAIANGLQAVQNGHCSAVGHGIGFQDGQVAEAQFGKGCSIWPSARGCLVADKNNDAVRLIQEGRVTTVVDFLRRSSDGGVLQPCACIEDPTNQYAYYVAFQRHCAASGWVWGHEILHINVPPVLQLPPLHLSLLGNAQLSDVTFVVDGQKIHCVRAMLCVASEYFATQLSERWATGDVIIEDASYGAFRCVLEYLMVGTVQLAASTVMEVHGLADRFLLPSLKALCLSQVDTCLTRDNCCTLVVEATKYKAEALRAAAVKFLQHHVDEVRQLPSFASLPPDVLLHLLVTAHRIVAEANSDDTCAEPTSAAI